MPQLDIATFLPQILWFLSLYTISLFIFSKVVLPRIAKQLKVLKIASIFKKKRITRKKDEKHLYFVVKKNRVLENFLRLSTFYFDLNKKQSFFLNKIVKK